MCVIHPPKIQPANSPPLYPLAAAAATAARVRVYFVSCVVRVPQVDTGGSAERAPCLVRTLCALLRKVSLHALLQGAGKTRGGGAEGAGLHVDTTEVINSVALLHNIPREFCTCGGTRIEQAGGCC